jgi:hypothetical protein
MSSLVLLQACHHGEKQQIVNISGAYVRNETLNFVNNTNCADATGKMARGRQSHVAPVATLITGSCEGHIMFTRRKNLIRGNGSLAVVLTLALSIVGTQQAIAQENEEVAAPQEAYDITGGKSAGQLQNDLNKIESGFFKAFNNLNTNKNFKVKCKKVKTLGSRRRVQVCQPRFASRFEAEANRNLVNNSGSMDYSHLEGSDVWVRMKEQEKLFWEAVSKTTVDNEVMREKFAELSRAKRALAAASQ